MIFNYYKKFHLKILEKLVDKTIPFLNNHLFSKSNGFQNGAVKFFALTSKITHFFLFDSLGIAVYLVFFVYVFLANGENFALIYYATLTKGWASFFTNFFHYLDWSFFFLVGFLGILFELVFINTVLVSISEIKNKIGIDYGDNFLRDRGYNSRLSSLARTSERGFTLGVSLGAAFLGAAAGQIHETSSYERSYDKYLEVKQANPTADIKPPVPKSETH
jgi:hypothetical protein